MHLRFEPGKGEWEKFLDLQLKLVGAQIADCAGVLGATYASTASTFSRSKNKYFKEDDAPVLRLAHNAQYTIFLYLLSRAVAEKGERLLADRIYSLLRMASAVDIYYEVKLPKVWGCDHPLGSVIGRGVFDERATFFFAQNCNVGNNRGVYPKISGNLHMMSGSSLLGDTRTSGNVVLANGACAIDAGELSDCLVFGRSPDLVVKPLSAERFSEIWRFEA